MAAAFMLFILTASVWFITRRESASYQSSHLPLAKRHFEL
jgi:hypothetical protein